MSFGSRLREARQAKNMNQKELGALIGVTGNAVSNYENGTSSPNDHILLKIFNVLEVEPNFLFQDSFSYTTKAPAEQELVDEHEINTELAARLWALTPEEWAKVDAFVQGLLASR